MRIRGNIKPRRTNQANTVQTKGSLGRVTMADSWSALDEILHYDSAPTELADKYFCEAWFWSRENACQSKEAYFDLLSCYSESDYGSICHILTKEPNMDPKTMSLREQEHLYWPKQGTTTEMYKNMIETLEGVVDDAAFLKGVPKEMALFCYLATKKTPNFIRTQFYATTYEIYGRLCHHSHHKYTPKVGLPKMIEDTIFGR